MTNPQADYDSPWKQALFEYFPSCIEFFFPDIHADINWEQGFEFLNTELQQIVRDAEVGRRLADALVKVWRRSGEETWVLVHIEIQSQQQPDFAERMYIYHNRIFDLYRRAVASLAILADDRPSWRPNLYSSEIWRCRAILEYPVVKLLDYEADWESLSQSRNPFAITVMAHLKTMATRQDDRGRLQWKLNLVKGLYERGYTRETILELFRLIDWMMVLPRELERNFREEFIRYQEERNMPYVTSIERLAREEGIEQGALQTRREDVLDLLSIRFEEVPSSLAEMINTIGDEALLKTLLRLAATAGSLAEFQEAIAPLIPQS